MSAQIVQPTRPGRRFWFLWMLATVVGVATGLILSFPFDSILVAAIGLNATPPWTATETVLIILLKGAEGGVMGMGMGLGQWLVFRKYLRDSSGWIIATGLAFFLQGAFRWMLPYNTPAVQVGVITLLSFGIFLGLGQWFVLRGRVPNAGWWIAISIAGWASTLAFFAVNEYAQLPIESTLGIVSFAFTLLMPFAVAGGGMVWLLRQTTSARQPIAS
jgi:hypothetical protein